MSIRYKILLSFLLVIYGVLLTATLVNFQFSRRQVLQEISEKLESVVLIKASDITGIISRYQRIADALARQKVESSGSEQAGGRSADSSTEFFRTAFLNALATNPPFRSMVYVHNGVQEVFVGDVDTWNNAVHSFRCIGGQNESVINTCPVLLDETTGSVYLQITATTCSVGPPCGDFVSIIADWSEISEISHGQGELGQSGGLYLVTLDFPDVGYYLTAPVSESEGERSFAVDNNHVTNIVTRALYGNTGLYTDTSSHDQRGVRVIAAARQIDSLNASLIGQIDRKEALRPVTAVENSLFLSLNVIAVLAAIPVVLLSRSMSGPILALAEAAKRTSQKRQPVYVPVDRQDELGILAEAFNTMTHELTELNQSLERKVFARTRELSEERAKDDATLESIGDGIVVMNEHGTVNRCNAAVCKMFRVNPTSLLGRKWPLFGVCGSDTNPMPISDLPEYQALSSLHVVRRGMPDPGLYLRADGTRFPAAVTASPITHDGRILGVIAVFKDISKELRIDQLKTEFVSMASHQLRTPLTTIRWYAESILTGSDHANAERQRSSVEQIRHSTLSMIELVESLLNVSRLELGTLVVRSEPVRISDLIRTVIMELQVLADRSRVSVRVEDSPNISCTADRQLLHLIFTNVISNAIKYSYPDNPVVIHWDTGRSGDHLQQSEKEDSIVIHIRNTGIGIDDDDAEHIFTKLFRAKNAQRHTQEGTGLGLYMVRTILRMIGGSIGFLSKPGSETVFTVTIPLTSETSSNGT